VRTLELDLEVYQGPFDLLLSLVLKEEIDLLEVPLFEVILAYLEEMEAGGATDYWDEMTEFLLLMSLLLEVKSRLLLPGAYPELETELSPEEARDQLLSRLFEYSKFKAAAAWLRDTGEANTSALLRPPSQSYRRRMASVEEVVGTGDVLELRRRLVQVIEARREPDTAHVAQVKVELQRQIRTVRKVLARRGHFSFNSVFGGEEPLVQAVSLMALLDLLTRGEIRVSQPQIFADIVVRAVAQRKSA
jgi:segregation and condensation protein A